MYSGSGSLEVGRTRRNAHSKSKEEEDDKETHVWILIVIEERLVMVGATEGGGIYTLFSGRTAGLVGREGLPSSIGQSADSSIGRIIRRGQTAPAGFLWYSNAVEQFVPV